MSSSGNRPRISLRAPLPPISQPLYSRNKAVQVVSSLCSLAWGCRFAEPASADTLALPAAARGLRDCSQVSPHTPLLLRRLSQGLFPFQSFLSTLSLCPHLSHSDRLT